MDMKISGSGHLPGGEYEAVTISGSGRCHGVIKCKSFHGSGSTHCEDDILCEDSFAVSGSGHLDRNVKAAEIRCSGSFHLGDTAEAQSHARFSGSSRIGGNCISHGELHASGSFCVGGDIEAENARIFGVVECGGLLNAETLYMELESNRSRVTSIGGSSIEIKPRHGSSGRSFTIFGWRISRGERDGGSAGIVLEVAESIEGDEIRIEAVKAGTVVGRTVFIGENCRIGTVRYSESIEVADSAVVENIEKV